MTGKEKQKAEEKKRKIPAAKKKNDERNPGGKTAT